LNVYYKNNLKSSHLIIEGEERENEDYQIAMLQENNIPGLLSVHVRYIDNRSDYYYDVSGMQSMKNKYEKEKLREPDMKRLIQDLLNTMQEVKKYMLDGENILLDPEYIFCERDKFAFVYYPACDQKLKEAFHKLTEFFVREVDYRNKEGVHLAYTFHKATMEEHYSIEKIMEEIEGEDIYFSYKIMTGRATTRNAIKLLGIMGYDETIIRTAEIMANDFLTTGSWKGDNA